MPFAQIFSTDTWVKRARRLPTLLFVYALVHSLPLHADKAQPPLPPPCTDELKKQASSLIFDLSLVLDQKNSLSTDEFAGISQALEKVKNYRLSHQARNCFASDAKHKDYYQRWLRKSALHLFEKAEARLELVCKRRTRIFTHSKKLRITQALNQKKLAKAANLAAELRDGLENRPELSRCKSTSTLRKSFLDTYIPSVLNQAALPKVRSELGQSYSSLQADFELLSTVLTNRDRVVPGLPDSFDSPAKVESFFAKVKKCIDYAKALPGLGASRESQLSGESSQGTVGESEDFCESLQERRAEITSNVRAHQIRYDAYLLAKWKRISLKSWSMEKVFNARGRPAHESINSKSGQILWMYSDDSSSPNSCLQVSFSPKGKKLAEKARPCATSKIAVVPR